MWRRRRFMQSGVITVKKHCSCNRIIRQVYVKITFHSYGLHATSTSIKLLSQNVFRQFKTIAIRAFSACSTILFI